MTITLRQESATGASTKGSALTYAELDNNFIHLLRQGSVTVRGDSGTDQTLGEADKDSILQFVGGTNITTTLSSSSAGETVVTIDASASGIANVVEDTTPQLGGNLDVNGQSIVSVSNGNITIAPNGTGKTIVSNLTYDEVVYTGLSTSGTLTPDPANGSIQAVSLSGNITINALGGTPAAGDSVTLIIDTNGTGRTLTSTMLFAGGSKTLSTTDTTDILTIVYDGTNYYASLATNFS